MTPITTTNITTIAARPIAAVIILLGFDAEGEIEGVLVGENVGIDDGLKVGEDVVGVSVGDEEGLVD